MLNKFDLYNNEELLDIIENEMDTDSKDLNEMVAEIELRNESFTKKEMAPLNGSWLMNM